ncbi:MAG: DivIVA domain-containing protein [Candidatus Nanopelagicales bacterium]
MTMTAQDVHDKQFKLVRQTTGYDMDEVDAFLDEVEGEIERLNKLIASQREALDATQNSTATSDDTAGIRHLSAPALDEPPAAGAARILEMAQRTAEAYLAEARSDGEAVVAQARQAAEAERDAVDGQRRELAEQIESLRSVKADIQTKLRDYLQRQLLDIESLDQDQAQASDGTDAVSGQGEPAAVTGELAWSTDATASGDANSHFPADPGPEQS